MDERQNDLFYGSILHDLGKIVQRATNKKIKHSVLGSEFLEKFTTNKNILNQLKYHHYFELENSSLGKKDLSYITYIADNIASGSDRRKNGITEGKMWDSRAPLEDIFNRFGSTSTSRFFTERVLDLKKDKIFPQKNKIGFEDSEYEYILAKIEHTFSFIDFSENYQQSVLNLLEGTASFIPSSTNMREVADISLYDHLRMTAAFASAIYQYLEANEIENYAEEVYKNSAKFYEEKAFLLTSFDISGIQNFIYTITSKGAHKQLRSRSFYLDMMSEWIVDQLLFACNLSRANLTYAGGGHAYFVLPNTKEIRLAVKDIEGTINKFFLRNFGNELFVAFGNQEFSASEVMEGNNPKDYQQIYRKVSKEISKKKLNRYTAEDISYLNIGGKKSGRECAICHRVDNLIRDEKNQRNICQLCASLESFSLKIQKEEYFEVNNNNSGLPLSQNAFLNRISKEDIKKSVYSGKIYSKNSLNSGNDQATKLWIGDYSDLQNNDFSSYAQRKWTLKENGSVTGIKRIAVLRCDVDDLGYAFMAGFSQQNKGKFNTFSRTATFSRSMSMFFKFYINLFAENKRLTIVYAGGDDVFILGAWDDVINFAIDFRQKFIKWTNNKLTMSAGIGIFPDKTPINTMAEISGELESTAKKNQKDSICLFSQKFTFKFDTFIDDVYQEKLLVIRDFFNGQDERGKAFIYKLLDLIRQRDEEDRISFARLVYYLARLEDVSKEKEGFRVFKDKMKNWFDSSSQIKGAELAMMIYIYETRKED